jgi:hypothetical protein
MLYAQCKSNPLEFVGKLLLQSTSLTQRIADETVLQWFAEVAAERGAIPTQADLVLKKKEARFSSKMLSEPAEIDMRTISRTNPPLGSAFAAPFAKGGRQTHCGWRGDFYRRFCVEASFFAGSSLNRFAVLLRKV